MIVQQSKIIKLNSTDIEQIKQTKQQDMTNSQESELTFLINHLTTLNTEEKKEFVENFIALGKMQSIALGKETNKTIRRFIDEIFPLTLQIDFSSFIEYLIVIQFIVPLQNYLTSEEIYQLIAANIDGIDIRWFKKFYDYLINEQQMQKLIFLDKLKN